ncbi:MAG: hypothetical protein RDV00_07945 [Clostridia bacterium]|nr:hypothetical protein [Clostridia bacterium]
MPRTRRPYPPEFRAEAVRLVRVERQEDGGSSRGFGGIHGIIATLDPAA